MFYDVSSNSSRGAFVFSLDTELAWGGVHSRNVESRQSHFAGTRGAVRRLLGLLETFEIRATWAVVGHLMLDECSRTGSVPHPEIVRPEYDWRQGDWFDLDPCSTSRESPHWYAPDMIESILACKVAQEIGCHTFSHVIVGDPGCSKECFTSELQACLDVADDWGLELRSFVFPRNSIAHLDVLRRFGFTAFRGEVETSWGTSLPGTLGRAARAALWSTPAHPLTAPVSLRAGMWDIPATSFFIHRDGLASKIPMGMRVWRATRGVEQAAKDGSIFHLYLHPFNLASDPDALLGGLESVFRHVATLRDRGKLWNPTMGRLAAELGQIEVRV